MVNTTLPNTRVHADQVEREEEPRGMVDRILGSRPKAPEGQEDILRSEKSTPQNYANKEVSIFDRHIYSENEKIPQQIEELKNTIRTELNALKEASTAFSAEVNHIQKHATSTHAHESGKYHVNLLQTVISMIKLLHVKVSEGNSWMKAIQGRDSKRTAGEEVQKNQIKVQYESSGMNQGL